MKSIVVFCCTILGAFQVAIGYHIFITSENVIFKEFIKFLCENNVIYIVFFIIQISLSIFLAYVTLYKTEQVLYFCTNPVQNKNKYVEYIQDNVNTFKFFKTMFSFFWLYVFSTGVGGILSLLAILLITHNDNFLFTKYIFSVYISYILSGGLAWYCACPETLK
jgi:hypothetical protein